MSDFFPEPPERKDYKPLSKGMITTLPSSLVPDGAFLQVKDMYVTPNGLQRRNGNRVFFQTKENFAKVPVVTGEVISDMEGFFDETNSLQLLAFSTKRLYVNRTGDEFVPVPFGRALHTITLAGAGTIEAATVEAATAALGGDITGTTFTDTTHGSGAWAVGMLLTGAGVLSGTTIVSFLTGTGTNTGGTYEVSLDHTTPVVAQTINGIATDFIGDRVASGDTLRINTGTEWIEAPISNVLSRTQLQLTIPGGVTSGMTMYVVREFNLPEGSMVDYTFSPGYLVLVDGTDRGIWKYDGHVMEDMKVVGDSFDVSAGNEFYLKGAKTVYYFNGYLILGNTIERYAGAGEDNAFDQKRTIRWSSISKTNEFAVEDYVLFTRETSEVRKITSAEECPVVFLANAIYFGTPSGLEGLPYQYNRIESGAISAVGQRAMAAVPGGLVFIAQKNIYFMELAKQGTRVPVLTPIGDEIYNKANFENGGPLFSRVLFSPQQNMLMCCFPKQKSRLGRIFCLSGETKSWSYLEDEPSKFTCANVFPYYLLLRWQDGDAQDWDEYNAFTWFSLKLEDYTNRVFMVDVEGYVYVSDDAYDWDEIPDAGTELLRAPFQCIVESGDLDMGSPGHYKILNQMIFTVADVATRERTSDLTCNIQISTDRGRSWVDKGDILFETGSYIEDVHLRATGEVIRYKLTFGADAPLFNLAELQLRFRRSGNFVQRGL